MRKNINISNITYGESVFGSCRVTQKLSTCVIFSIVFTYMYNEWITPEFVFGTSSVFTLLGYVLYLLVDDTKMKDSERSNISNADKEYQYKKSKLNNSGKKCIDEDYIDHLFKINMEKSLRKSTKKKGNYIYLDKNSQLNRPLICNSSTAHIFNDFKTVLIYLFFGYLFSPILHTLTDTVSTDTIFATTIFMMIIHLIFSDYGISVAVVSNSLSINSAIFGSICLASRLCTSFCAFVLITVAIQAFVLSPVLIKLIWNGNYFVFVFSVTVIVTLMFLWNISRTLFHFFVLSVLFLNFYCPFLFVRWQKYKDNIYGPWDEAIVHDSDDVSDIVL